MKVLLVGAGGVGEAIAVIAKRRDPKSEWMEQMVLCDYSLSRAKEVAAKLKDSKRFPVEQLDAGRKEDITALAKKYSVDIIMNACAPQFNMSIFDAAFDAGCMYMDMAMSLSEKDPQEPYKKPGIKL